MATARLITAEIFDFSPPPQHIFTESIGTIGKFGSSITLRTVVSLSEGQRDTFGTSIQMGVSTGIVAVDQLTTVITGTTLTTELI